MESIGNGVAMGNVPGSSGIFWCHFTKLEWTSPSADPPASMASAPALDATPDDNIERSDSPWMAGQAVPNGDILLNSEAEEFVILLSEMKTATAYSLSLAHWALNEYPPTADNLGKGGSSCLIVHCTCNVSLLTGIEMTSLSDSRTSRQYRVASRSDFWYQQKDDLVALWQMPSTTCRQVYSENNPGTEAC